MGAILLDNYLGAITEAGRGWYLEVETGFRGQKMNPSNATYCLEYTLV